MVEQGVRCKLFPAMALVQYLQQAKRDLDLMAAMTRLDKYRVIIIDDIGYVKKTDAETQMLFEFIAHRYESGSLISLGLIPRSLLRYALKANGPKEKIA